MKITTKKDYKTYSPIHLMLTPEEAGAFRDESKRLGLSNADLFRKMWEEWLKKQEE